MRGPCKSDHGAAYRMRSIRGRYHDISSFGAQNMHTSLKLGNVPRVKEMLCAGLANLNMGPRIERVLYAAGFTIVPYLAHKIYTHL